MRVLIISHNVLSLTNNMGKTLLSYFAGFQPNEVAQFYIQPMAPVDDTVCRNYYRFTDQDALRSLNPFRRYGQVLGQADIRPEGSGKPDSGLISDAYRMGQKRTPLIYFLRNALWRMSRWDTPQLRKWIRDFDPDVLFFAAGDYSFMNRVANRIADIAGKPMATVCVDDFYLNNRNAHSLFGRMQHKWFLKTVYAVMDRSSMVLTICDSMAKAYHELFHKDCRVLHTPVDPIEAALEPHASAISYIGNLLNGRSDNLVKLGKALKKMNPKTVNAYIDVYSTEQNPAILKDLTEENGIRFHGAVPAREVRQIMNRSAAVIHTESFDAATRALVRFSVSTKIAESLMYGPCLIAYGPDDVASVQYLRENNAAFVITGEDGIEEGLKTFLEDEALRCRILENARALGRQNHDVRINSANLRRWLAELCQGGET